MAQSLWITRCLCEVDMVFWSCLPSHLCLQSGRLHAWKAPNAWIRSSNCRGWTWEPAPCGDLEYFCSASCNPTEQWSAESFLDPVRWGRAYTIIYLRQQLSVPELTQNDLSKYKPSHLPGCRWCHSHIKKSASSDHGPGNLSFFLFWHLKEKGCDEHVFEYTIHCPLPIIDGWHLTWGWIVKASADVCGLCTLVQELFVFLLLCATMTIADKTVE